jgi:hypothetical protein
MRKAAVLFGVVLVALGTIAGCPEPHQLSVVDRAMQDPTNIDRVTVTDRSEEVDFYHPATVDIDGETGDVHIVGGDGAGGGPVVTINTGGGSANANSNSNSNGNNNGNSNGNANGNGNSNSSAGRINITGVRIVSGPPDGQNWYTGDLVIFEVTTDGDGEIHFMPPDARIAGDYTTQEGKVQISYRFVSPVGTDREAGVVYCWPQDRNTEVVSISIVVRRRVAH